MYIGILDEFVQLLWWWPQPERFAPKVGDKWTTPSKLIVRKLHVTKASKSRSMPALPPLWHTDLYPISYHLLCHIFLFTLLCNCTTNTIDLQSSKIVHVFTKQNTQNTTCRITTHKWTTCRLFHSTLPSSGLFTIRSTIFQLAATKYTFTFTW